MRSAKTFSGSTSGFVEDDFIIEGLNNAEEREDQDDPICEEILLFCYAV